MVPPHSLNHKDLTEKVLLQDVGREQPYEDRVFRRNVSMTVTEFSTGDIPYNLTEEEKANQPDLLRLDNRFSFSVLCSILTSLVFSGFRPV